MHVRTHALACAHAFTHTVSKELGVLRPVNQYSYIRARYTQRFANLLSHTYTRIDSLSLSRARAHTHTHTHTHTDTHTHTHTEAEKNQSESHS